MKKLMLFLIYISIYSPNIKHPNKYQIVIDNDKKTCYHYIDKQLFINENVDLIVNQLLKTKCLKEDL